MPDLRLPDPWDEMIHLLQRLNFDHLDAIESNPAAAISTLAMPYDMVERSMIRFGEEVALRIGDVLDGEVARSRAATE